jgi:hypothetical protein
LYVVENITKPNEAKRAFLGVNFGFALTGNKVISDLSIVTKTISQQDI